jgi:hypothetical protein
MIDLGVGTYPGQAASHAWGVNNARDVVGHISANSDQFAVLWRPGQSALTLEDVSIGNSDEWRLHDALSINDSGFIAGNGTRFGVIRGFLLVPVPEPATLTLGLCLFGVLAFRIIFATSRR